MRLPVSTWPDIETWLKQSSTIVIPIGSFEQHGPNGFIGTDALCPEIIANHADSLDPEALLVGPTFNVGCAQHHLGFPGTVTLRPSTMIAAMVDWTESLMRHGFRRFYWLNGHGGNIATIEAAFAEIHARRSFDPDGARTRPDLALKRRDWWDFREVMDLCNTLYPTGHGSHATPSEVSVTYWAYPGHERSATPMNPAIAPAGSISDAIQYRRDFPDGRIGSDPSQSRIDHGGQIVATAARCLLQEVGRFSA